MIKTQQWTPDTCANEATGDACILEETWDNETPTEARVHVFSRVIRRCSRHAALAGEDCYNTNRENNRRKNVAVSIAQQVKNLDLNTIRWWYDADVLHVDLGSQFTNQQKTQAQNWCDLQFGAWKVVIE